MADNLNVKTKTKTVSNAKSAKQEQDLKAAKAKREADAKKASETKAANLKKKQEAAKVQESKAQENIDTAALLSSISSLTANAVTSKKKKGFLSGLILGLIIGIALTSIFGLTILKNSLDNLIDTSKDTADEIIDETFYGYTALDFKDAILTKTIEQQKLVVMEQYLEIETTITKAGLGNLEIFSKAKNIIYSGMGNFTVDLSKVTAEKIEVDETNKVVTITIPHAELYNVSIDFENIKYEDTEKGLLSFGDIKLTTEDSNQINASVEQSMKETLSKKSILDKADEYAIEQVYQTFAPIVIAMDEEYVVEIKF